MSQTPCYEHRFQVPFHEVDRAGVGFFAHLFTHAHHAYERCMADLGFGLDQSWPDMEYALPIVHAEADYHAPLRHGMEVRVILSIPRLGRGSFTSLYQFLGPQDLLLARLQLVHCCIHPKTGHSAPLPDGLRKRLLTLNQ